MLQPILDPTLDRAGLQAEPRSKPSGDSGPEGALFDSLLDQALSGNAVLRHSLLGFTEVASAAGGSSPAPGLAKAAAAATASATATLARGSISREQMRTIYYGPGGAQHCSEKASEHGQFEISHFPITTSGNGLVLSATNIYNRADQGGAEGSQVGVYDYDAILRVNGGKMPASAEEMKQLLKDHPEVELARVKIEQPPEMIRINGVPAGTRVVVGVGLDGLDGGKAGRIQAMLSDFDALPAATQALVPSVAK
jgi:hypothetical protein